jgi:hypothetical protein
MWFRFGFPVGPSTGLQASPFSKTASAIGKVVLCLLLVSSPESSFGKVAAKYSDLWSLKPLAHPEIPQGVSSSANPIDAFIAETCRDKGVTVFVSADKLTWLRRVSLDLIGLPPTLE